MGFRLVQVTVILHYFTEFMYDVLAKQLSWFQNLLLIVCDAYQYDLRNYSAIIWAKQTLITRIDGRRCQHQRMLSYSRSRFDGRRRWPVHVQCCRKKFMFAISSPDLMSSCSNSLSNPFSRELRHSAEFNVARRRYALCSYFRLFQHSVAILFSPQCIQCAIM